MATNSILSRLETFYIRSVYKNIKTLIFLSVIAFMDFKPYNKFNTDQDHFIPLRIRGTDEAT